MLNELACRFCRAPLEHVLVDLGVQPLANAYLCREALNGMEPFYPLTVYVCGECLLVQLPAVQTPEAIFSDYAYFSSYSDSWLDHCRRYVSEVVDRYGLDARHKVVEVASNDGYLLQYFQEAGLQVLGVEPAANVAKVAVDKGVPTVTRFFGRQTAEDLATEHTADLLIGNNVLAHVPDLNDFVSGLKRLLAPAGVLTMEFPHLAKLLAGNQFDTIYHEHFSYFSLTAAVRIFAAHGLPIVCVDELPTHGGSLRIHARHEGPADESVSRILREEAEAGLDRLEGYGAFSERVAATKRALLSFLVQARNEGRRIVAYGAAAKGNTLLNYCGVRTDFIDFVADRSPHKQGTYLPGVHIPVRAPEAIAEARPDYVLILPWNLREEVMSQLDHVRAWGGRFVVAVPELRVLA